MLLNKIGEFGFISRFASKFSNLLQNSMLGIGDDCALLTPNKNKQLAISTDLLIEGTHFLLEDISFDILAKKSLAVNLSDLAAMGAKPLGSFLSLGLPSNLSVENLDLFMQGFYEISRKFACPLLGGDTNSSKDKLIINICILGEVEEKKAKLRSHAKVGDLICTTGFLGDSAAGLQIILQKLLREETEQYLINRHYQVIPLIEEGYWLCKQDEVGAMIDISDGIASDLKHILQASLVAARIELSKLPLSSQLLSVCSKYNWSAEKLACDGGEDYELLFTINATNFENFKQKYKQKFQKDLFEIGKIKEGNPQIFWLNKGKKSNFKPKGFNHFN